MKCGKLAAMLLVVLCFSLAIDSAQAQPTAASLAAEVAAKNGVSAADVEISNISLARTYTVGDTIYKEWTYTYSIRKRSQGGLRNNPASGSAPTELPAELKRLLGASPANLTCFPPNSNSVHFNQPYDRGPIWNEAELSFAGLAIVGVLALFAAIAVYFVANRLFEPASDNRPS
jgi:hypothetical protein